MRKIAVLFLILFAPVAMAQENPVGPPSTTPTTTGAILEFTGGSRPLSLYRDNGVGGWNTISTSIFNDVYIINDQPPSSTRNYSVVGNNVGGPTDGITFSITSLPAATGSFNDVTTTYWAYSQIEWMATSGMSSGCGGGNYCPDNTMTRAEMAVFFKRFYDLFIAPQ